MRRGARLAFVVSAALAALAVGSSRGDVRIINLDGCSGSCFAPPIEDPSVAKNKAAKTTLSRSGGATRHPSAAIPALEFDQRTAPTVPGSGLPPPLASVDGAAYWLSPYDYFEDVIDIPLPVAARAEFAAASLFLFAPSFIGRLSFTDVLSAAVLSGKYSPPPPRPSM